MKKRPALSKKFLRCNRLFQQSVLVTSLMLIFAGSRADADVLIMDNGDRLTGEIVAKEGEIITFQTPYGEPFEIKWENVKELKSDEDVKVLSSDGQVMETREITESSSPVSKSEVDFINPEAWRTGEGYKFSGGLNFALKYERGNTDSDEHDIDWNMAFRDLKHRLRFEGEYENDSVDGTKTSDKGRGFVKYDRKISERTYVGALLGGERDRFADLDTRILLGPFVGYQFIESEKQNLHAELAVLWVEENYDDQPDDDYFAGGWSIGYDRFLLPKVLQFYHRNNGMLSTEDLKRVLVNSWTGLKVPIGWGFNTSGEVQLEYDSDPAEDADKLDETYSMKLGYEW